jgi:hypothetical protein
MQCGHRVGRKDERHKKLGVLAGGKTLWPGVSSGASCRHVRVIFAGSYKGVLQAQCELQMCSWLYYRMIFSMLLAAISL